MKALIAYCTRYGATATTSEVISTCLQEDGFDVRLVNTKKEKVSSISDYDLVIVGAGMQVMRWCGDAEKFIKKFQDELRKKNVAIFVSSGTQVLYKHDDNIEMLEKEWKKNLEDKVEKYALTPISLGMFGGIWDYNKMGFLARKTMGPLREKLEAAGIEEQEPDIYDTRDWEKIRKWTKNLAQKVKDDET